MSFKKSTPVSSNLTQVSSSSSQASISKVDFMIAAGKVKKTKRSYQLTNPLPPVESTNSKHDINIQAYKQFIINLLIKRGNVSLTEAEQYTSDIYMPIFIRAMTHDSVNPTQRADNYEMLEHFGDSVVNHIATYYLKNRFPDIVKRGDPAVDIISKQKSLITSKPFLAIYSEELKLSQFIRFRPLTFVYVNIKKTTQESTMASKPIVVDRSMKEDTFEAFFGALEEVIDSREGLVGVGYAICFKILSSLFDEQDIPFTKKELTDSKSQVKEIIDKTRPAGDKEIYSVDDGKLTLTLHFTSLNGKPADIRFGPYSIVHSDEGNDFVTKQKIVEQLAAGNAIKYLEKNYPSKIILQ